MWVKLNIPNGEQSAIRIPESAIVYKGEASFVYLKKQNQFSLRQVRLGEKQLASSKENKLATVEVLAGINNGDEVASNPAQVLAAQEI